MIDEKKNNEDNNGDIELDIKQLIKNKIIPREKQYISVDYLSYLIIKNRDNSLVILQSQDEFNYENNTFLFGLRKSFKDKTIKIINPIKATKQTDKGEINDLRKKLWYIVNSEDKEKINEDYILNENDIIRFGDFVFEVIKIGVQKIANEAQNGDQLYNISSINNKYGLLFKIKNYDNQKDSEQNENKKLTCQICGEDSDDNENPLLKICNCYNHFKCLREKLISKIKIKLKTQRVYSFNSLDFECSECQKIVPLRFEKLGKIYNFLEFENMFYIVLEYLGKIDNEEKNNENDKKQNPTKVYIINLNDKSEIKIGKNWKDIINDIDLQDDYISRKHAVIKFNNENGNLILENRSITEVVYNKEDGTLFKKQKEKIENINEEKIGKLAFSKTFVLIKDNFKLKKNIINFRVGNCYIKAKLK